MSNIQGGAQTSRVMVTVHGAGDWPIGYAQPMLQAITSGLLPAVQGLQVLEANYTDVLKSLAMQAARAAAGNSAQPLMNALVSDHLQSTIKTLNPEQLLQNLIRGLPQVAGLAASTFFPGSEIVLNALCQIITHQTLDQLKNSLLAGIFPTVQDVVVYLYAQASFQNAFRQRLIDQLHAAQNFDEVILVSHSLGAVIAFDVLNTWTGSQPNITSWFTMGCPLAKVLRIDSDRQPQLANPNVVGRWFNVYNPHDLIANPLTATFTKDSVYDIFVDVKDPQHTDPGSAHDYFSNPHALKLVADAINAFG